MKPHDNPGAFQRSAGACARVQRGATLVEFAIAGPIAILIIMALIQLGLLMTAKQVVNEATFEAARMGASEHARKKDVMRALERKLLPFYQDSTDKNATTRLGKAAVAEFTDLTFNIGLLNGPRLTVSRLSPPDPAFQDFGINVDDGNGGQDLAIPNDNLEYRLYDKYKGPQSGLTIQDANELRIKVVFSYELKVPLMKTVVKSVMCGFDSGVNAFGRGTDSSVLEQVSNFGDCFNYYNRGRVPITAYATVQMQSDAFQDKQNWGGGS